MPNKKQQTYKDWTLPSPSKAEVKRAEQVGRKLGKRNTDPAKAWVSFRIYPSEAISRAAYEVVKGEQ